VGALLRREGLYSSHLTTWRAARERGALAGPTAVKKRGPAPRVPDPRDKRIAELERSAMFWRKRAERAEALIEVQKNIAALLGTPANTEHSS
jgi:transposase